MTGRDVIALDADLGNGEVGELVDPGLIVTRHPDGLALDADRWSDLAHSRQAAGRPLHWWEVPTHG